MVRFPLPWSIVLYIYVIIQRAILVRGCGVRCWVLFIERYCDVSNESTVIIQNLGGALGATS